MNIKDLENIDGYRPYLKDIEVLHKWARLYSQYFIYKEKTLNITFALVLKTFNIQDCLDHLSDNKVLPGEWECEPDGEVWEQITSYLVWCYEDGLKAFMTDTQPVYWMKLRILKDPNGKEFFNSIELERLKKESQTIPLKEETNPGIINIMSGYVYVIRDMESGLYKIGETQNWQRRFKELNVDNQRIVIINLKWFPNRKEIEKYHHEINRDYRLPQSEWFKLSKAPMI